MEIWLWGSICFFLIFILLLIIKIRLMQRSADEIAAAFKERVHQQTNLLIDISSRDRHLLQLADVMNTELRQFRDERQRFTQGDMELKESVANIAHDIRTPLTAISGYLQLMNGEESAEKQKKYLDLIRNRAESLKRLSEELFKYSIIHTQTEIKKERLILNSVLEESLVSMYDLLKGAKIKPHIHITENPVERSLDYLSLLRIFENIISNVIKYSDGDFNVSMAEDGLITFSNRAENLDPISVGRLFDRFYTIETGRMATGLGLNISKILTERMNGKISAEYSEKVLKIHIHFPPY